MCELNNELMPVSSPPTDDPVVSPAGISLRVRVTLLSAVIAPFLGLLAAIVSLWGWGFRWSDLLVLTGMYLLTVLGITVGFHRLFTHRAFETHRAIQLLFAVLGSMAVQGPLLQ